jgi:hypothetical protein
MNPAKPAPVKTSKPSAPAPAPVTKTRRQFKLDSKNLRLMLLGAFGLSVVLFVAILLLGLSALGKESQKMVDLKVKGQTADAQLSNLEQAKKQVEQYSYFKDIAKTVIPDDKDQAASVVEINNMAQESGIAIQSITFPASTLGLTTATTSAKSAQDATASSAASKAISQATPVSGISGLYSLALTITPESDAKTPPDKIVTYSKMLDFLRRIENNRHTAQITDVNISPASASGNNSSGNLTFSLTVNIFIKP